MSAAAERVELDNQAIEEALESGRHVDDGRVRAILDKAAALQGLDGPEVATLAAVTDPHQIESLFATARQVKETVYGRRLVLFAPLYVSNLCHNECRYCAFRASNTMVQRRALGQEELAQEVRALVETGHKRVLLVAGESYPEEGFDYVLRCIDTIYATRSGPGAIRRINVNVAPLTEEEFRRLKARQIGTYQLFQETYDRETYRLVHTGGPKRDYDWRLSALDRAMAAGIDDVGIGVLFGLADWRYEILAMLQHIRHLEARFGVGPHTISVPRLEPATGSELSLAPPAPLADADFCKLVAILRLAVPYTGIIMSTRETAALRRRTLALGVSQISAGSRTNPGGYADGEQQDEAFSQFQLGDHRPLDAVIQDVASMGYLPSFCTGCYRLGRTGKDFMDLARPGEIRLHCDPNGLSTFAEYLADYASTETRRIGNALIEATLAEMEPAARERAAGLVAQVRAGARDVYC